jgi:hypothetical protein
MPGFWLSSKVQTIRSGTEQRAAGQEPCICSGYGAHIPPVISKVAKDTSGRHALLPRKTAGSHLIFGDWLEPVQSSYGSLRGPDEGISGSSKNLTISLPKSWS